MEIRMLEKLVSQFIVACLVGNVTEELLKELSNVKEFPEKVSEHRLIQEVYKRMLGGSLSDIHMQNYIKNFVISEVSLM